MDYDATVYGDAVFETSSEAARYNGSEYMPSILNSFNSWYGDFSQLPYTSRPWFYRNGVAGGIFGFSHSSGEPYPVASFRVVVVPQ